MVQQIQRCNITKIVKKYVLSSIPLSLYVENKTMFEVVLGDFFCSDCSPVMQSDSTGSTLSYPHWQTHGLLLSITFNISTLTYTSNVNVGLSSQCHSPSTSKDTCVGVCGHSVSRFWFSPPGHLQVENTKSVLGYWPGSNLWTALDHNVFRIPAATMVLGHFIQGVSQYHEDIRY